MHEHDPARIRRARTLSRIVGAAAGFVLGILYGTFVVTNSSGFLTQNRAVAMASLLAAGVAGATSLSLAAPLLSVDPFLWLQRTLDQAPPSHILGETIGRLVAWLASSLCARRLRALPRRL